MERTLIPSERDKKRFNIFIPLEVHASIVRTAEREDRSLRSTIIRLLEEATLQERSEHEQEEADDRAYLQERSEHEQEEADDRAYGHFSDEFLANKEKQ